MSLHELGRSADQVVGINAVRSLAELLAHKYRCLIDLLETDAVLEFGTDPRERFVYVDEFTNDEANQLIVEIDRD